MVLSLHQLPGILVLSDNQFLLGDNIPCINFFRHHMNGNPCNRFPILEHPKCRMWSSITREQRGVTV